MTDREFTALFIGGIIAVVIIAASIAYLVHEIRRTPAAGQEASDPEPFDYGPVDVDRVEEYVAAWAEQQRKEGR